MLCNFPSLEYPYARVRQHRASRLRGRHTLHTAADATRGSPTLRRASAAAAAAAVCSPTQLLAVHDTAAAVRTASLERRGKTLCGVEPVRRVWCALLSFFAPVYRLPDWCVRVFVRASACTSVRLCARSIVQHIRSCLFAFAAAAAAAAPYNLRGTITLNTLYLSARFRVIYRRLVCVCVCVCGFGLKSTSSEQR